VSIANFLAATKQKMFVADAAVKYQGIGFYAGIYPLPANEPEVKEKDPG
jgi:hypothetical protein